MNEKSPSYWTTVRPVDVGAWVIQFVLVVGLVCWLVGGSWWLALFLGFVMADVAEIYHRIRVNRQLFDIADAELVRVSALAHRLHDSSVDFKDSLETVRNEIDDLKRRLRRAEASASGYLE